MAARDPLKAWVRQTRAKRRVGGNACETCGEQRPFALITGRAPSICFACDRVAHARKPYELNHVFGKRNSPLTIRYPVNEHRAVFSVAQLEWPPGALENPTGSILLEGVARVHGLYDNVEHMLADCRTNSERLAYVDTLLTMVYGPEWLPQLEAAAKQASKKRSNASGE